jgi:creatinine amidohydrolase/Fe(II)-dependent formamide hydrolase-like protein
MNITTEKVWPKELLYWRRMSSKDISDYLKKTPKSKRLVLLVWGVLESHGPYMPVANDSHLASLAADKVAITLLKKHGIQPIIFNSWMDLGSRSATWEFPGAIGVHSSTVPVIRTMFEQTIERMVEEGFTKFFVVNGDGGNWMNHWFGIQWDSKVIRDLRKKHKILLRGSNWDQEGGVPYLHAGVYDHALITWACKYAPEFERMSAIRHGMRAPNDKDLRSIENDQAFLEDDPYRETDWSQYPGQKNMLSVTKFVYTEYMAALYNKDGSPRIEGGAKADFDAKIENLMKKVLAVAKAK